MDLSFFETMRGHLQAGDGRRHSIDFQVKAEASGLRHFLETGQARLTGVLHAPPWAELAPMDGEIAIAPPQRRRVIAYRCLFRNESAEEFLLVGEKKLRLLHPIDSLTRLPVRLMRAGEQVAQGELRFDLRDLPAFVASVWPSSGISRVEMHRPIGREPGTKLLSRSEHAVLEALVESMIAAGARVPAPNAESLAGALMQLADTPAFVVRFYRMSLRWLDATAKIKRKRRFAALTREERVSLLEELCGTAGKPSRRRQSRAVLQFLGVPIKSAHFDRDDYLAAIRHPEAAAPRATSPLSVVREPEPKIFERVVSAEQLESESVIEAEIAIVGTGAGGAPLAAALAQKGHAVVLLEEGRFVPRTGFVGSPLGRVRALWRDRGMNVTLGTPIFIPLGRVVGGTTTINSGTCFPTPDHVLAEWREHLGFPSDFLPESYHRYTKQVEDMLQVAPGEPHTLGRIAQFIARGADAMSLAHGPLPRNAPGCTGEGTCIFGCPEGAKRSTDVSYVPAALRAGAMLYTGLRMSRILMRGKRVVALEARGPDAFGAERTLRVVAERYVLACGAIHTPLVLMENGFRLPMLGKNLSVHPGVGLFARTSEDLEPWNGIPQGYAVHGLEEGGIRYEGFYLPPQLTAPAFPWVGAELSRWMDDFRRIAQFGFMVRDAGDGWVRRGMNGMPLVGYRLSARSVERIKKGASLLCELLLAAGANEVFIGFGPRPTISSVAEARAVANVPVSPYGFRLLGAHPLGTCRMAGSATDGVVDFDYRVFGTENLHVVDGSVVPTSLGVNPQVTIMSLALRAADLLHARAG